MLLHWPSYCFTKIDANLNRPTANLFFSSPFHHLFGWRRRSIQWDAHQSQTHPLITKSPSKLRRHTHPEKVRWSPMCFIIPALLDDLTLPQNPPASMSRVKRNGTFSGNGSPPPRSKAIPKSMLINSPVLSCKMRLSASWFSVSLTTCLRNPQNKQLKSAILKYTLNILQRPQKITKKYQLYKCIQTWGGK